MSKGFEDLAVYRLSEDLADAIWNLVIAWEPFPRSTVGGQPEQKINRPRRTTRTPISLRVFGMIRSKICSRFK